MTVEELINELAEFPLKARVVLCDGHDVSDFECKKEPGAETIVAINSDVNEANI